MPSSRLLLRLPLTRGFATTARLPASFDARPSPPRLPKEQQEEFERLQVQSTGAFQTPAPADGEDADLMHKDFRRGAKPEFEGERNPQTGEVGGPKNDPLKHNEWTYNGRATDF